MTGDIEHPASEFSKCPFDKFIRENQSYWSFGTRERVHSLYWANDDGTAEIWEMPECFSVIIETTEKCAVKDKIREIKRALEI